MYKIVINNVKNTHEYEELIKIFLQPCEYKITSEGIGDLVFWGSDDKNQTKRDIYDALSSVTGKHPKWGIITGIRPVKLFGDIQRRENSSERAVEIFRKDYLVSEEKARLVSEIFNHQQNVFGFAGRNTAGVYIGIPFCPSRCLYCAFTSNNADDKKIKSYLEALFKEIDCVSDMMLKSGMSAESIYIGGGTPTVLCESDLDRLLLRINERFFSSDTLEFTVEAGRPDTLNKEKIRIIENNGATRISINPQSMRDETIKAIGRNHTAAEVVDAVKTTKKISRLAVNMDIIAGLSGEEPNDFKYSIDRILDLDVENITVHSLAVKRSSRLAAADKNYHYSHGESVSEMLDLAAEKLRNSGYAPYYLYRQKHMSGALENVGYAKNKFEGLYNVRMMDEHQMIVALGAGGISKAYDYETESFTRVPNVSNYEVYIQRIDEMIKRKQDALFDITK